ncbi:hypothetical protein ACSS6W_010970 [Trichoderma asperelloides]
MEVARSELHTAGCACTVAALQCGRSVKSSYGPAYTESVIRGATSPSQMDGF